MKIKNWKLKTLARGFSLVETAIVLVVILVGFMVFFRLVNSYLITLKTAKERVIANFLAQEGLELVLAKRNQNFKDPSCSGAGNPSCPNWLAGLQPFEQDLCINPDLSVSACSDSKLYLSNNVYTHNPGSGATATNFARVVRLKDLGNFAEVASTVSWPNVTVQLKMVITRWHPNH